MVSRFRSSNDNKIYNRIKKIIHNPIKCSVVFSNDTFIETFTERKMEKVQKFKALKISKLNKKIGIDFTKITSFSSLEYLTTV